MIMLLFLPPLTLHALTAIVPSCRCYLQTHNPKCRSTSIPNPARSRGRARSRSSACTSGPAAFQPSGRQSDRTPACKPLAAPRPGPPSHLEHKSYMQHLGLSRIMDKVVDGPLLLGGRSMEHATSALIGLVQGHAIKRSRRLEASETLVVGVPERESAAS
jgi:hypothetical protein